MHGAYLSIGMLNFDSARSADMAADFPWAWNSWVDASKKVFQSSLPALAFSSDGASVQILNHVCVLESKLLPDEHITLTFEGTKVPSLFVRTWLTHHVGLSIQTSKRQVEIPELYRTYTHMVENLNGCSIGTAKVSIRLFIFVSASFVKLRESFVV